MAYLVIRRSGAELCRWELSGPVCVGRQADCELWLPDTHVSRKHCALRPTPDGWEIEDLGSRNGLTVDGQRVQRQLLQDGDVIRVGGVSITFHALGFVPARPDVPELTSPPAPFGAAASSSALAVAPTPTLARPAVRCVKRADAADPAGAVDCFTTFAALDSLALESADELPLPVRRRPAKPQPRVEAVLDDAESAAPMTLHGAPAVEVSTRPARTFLGWRQPRPSIADIWLSPG